MINLQLSVACTANFVQADDAAKAHALMHRRDPELAAAWRRQLSDEVLSSFDLGDYYRVT